MSRNAALLALFVASLAAGVWLFRPAPPSEVATESSCAEDEGCSAAPEPVATDEVAESPPPSPPPAPAPRAASPPDPAVDGKATDPAVHGKATDPAVDGKALRAEADRLLAEGSALQGIEKLREATRADPTAKNHGDLGDLLGRLTAMDESLVHLRQAAELDPGNADRWIALANAYYGAVNPGEAWKAEKRATEAEPGLVLGRDKNGRRVRQGDSEPRKP